MAGVESEWVTRKKRIDKLLEESSWKVIHYKAGVSHKEYIQHAVEEYPTDHGPADYVLFHKGEPLAVVEAKKVSLGAQNVLVQAQRYAKALQPSPFHFGEFSVPFVYSTNGEVVWYQDIRESHTYSRTVAKFHTPSGLREMLQNKQKEGLMWLKAHPEPHPRSRPYQVQAIQAVEEALGQQKRQMLLAMATGTGKTFTTVSLIHRLMKSGYGRRILFLVDRRALAAQAVREFSTFETQPGMKFDKEYEVYSERFKREDFEEGEKFNPKVLPKQYLEEPKLGQAFVYVCTIQRMRINLFGLKDSFEQYYDTDDLGDASKLDIPIHAFDIIIADECHRGYTAMEASKWRETLEHFDAVKIGLTATPAAHTTAYFRDIIFRYDYATAVREGYLVDYDPVYITSNVRMNGIFLKTNELVGIRDTATGKEKLDYIEDERTYESTKIEREITSPDSTTKIVQEFAKYARDQEAETGHFPKTLIFAVNDLPNRSHSDMVVKACREVLGRGDSFVQKITGSPTVDRPLQRIREFRNRPEPAVVVTVDMLSTGVDIPKLENIVFLRPVKSRILFSQMLGRGTRKCDEISKTHFTVFDCFGGSLLDYFKKATDFTLDAPEKPTKTIREVISDIYSNKDRKYNVGVLVKRLQRIAKNMSGEAIEDFERFIPNGDVSLFAQNLPDELEEKFVPTIKMLKDEQFLKLLEDYPKATKNFLIAFENKDAVSSEAVFRTRDGQELKPEEYITAFSKFVKENPEKIEAIRILLKRPAGWNTDALHELRTKLSLTTQRFTEENLRRAYHSELADIISIIKHAAKDEPLFTAQQRVEKAVERATKGREMTAEQKQWLDLIKSHLIINLAIEDKDFQLIPILARKGGLRKADSVFDGKIEPLLKKINEEIAK